MAERSLSELLVDVAMAGFLVNNMMQLDSGRWRVSLRKPGKDDRPESVCYEFAEGSTLIEALRGAYLVGMSKPGVPALRSTGTYVPRRPTEPDPGAPPVKITFDMLFGKKG